MRSVLSSCQSNHASMTPTLVSTPERGSGRVP
jgi:hypothetical protein